MARRSSGNFDTMPVARPPFSGAVAASHLDILQQSRTLLSRSGVVPESPQRYNLARTADVMAPASSHEQRRAYGSASGGMASSANDPGHGSASNMTRIHVTPAGAVQIIMPVGYGDAVTASQSMEQFVQTQFDRGVGARRSGPGRGGVES